MARQKHVFNSNEIPHLWAHQTQDSARNAGGNFYFSGDTIYSYGSHFPIARHVYAPTGKGKQSQPALKHAVLLTTRTYSVTTSGHVSAVRSSIPKDLPVFCVDDPSGAVESFPRVYVRTMERIIENISARARETTRNAEVEKVSALVQECNAFCKFFKLPVPKFPKLPEIDKVKLAAQAKAIKERREAHAAKRQAEWEARKAEMQATADAWNASGVCPHDPKHDANNWGDVRTCEHQREADEWTAKRDEMWERWRAGESVQLRDAYSAPIALRVRTFGADADAIASVGRVETSRGAQVPLTHAKALLDTIRRVVARGEEFRPNGHCIRIGHYSVDRIEVDGTLHAGCHVIALAEIERIAPQVEALFPVVN